MFYISDWFQVSVHKKNVKKTDLLSMTVWYWWYLRWHSRPWQCCSAIMSEMPPSHQVVKRTWKQSDDSQMISWPSAQEVLQPVGLYDGLPALDSACKPNSEQEEVTCKSNATTAIILPTNTQRVTIKRVILLWNDARWPRLKKKKKKLPSVAREYFPQMFVLTDGAYCSRRFPQLLCQP